MDLTADSDTRPLKSTTGGHDDFEHELSLSYTPHEMDNGSLSLQVLKFKTILLEAVEELHIHRDAEIRREEQISKLVLEKQELEWQKESLQHQIDTIANQHTEALSYMKKQFQNKIRAVEGEKGKHQLTAELKDKEINSLKEELKLLQLLKYSLEKKLSELEQKLRLQTQTKDSHLNQLGEVEKRFGALSRQCAVVRQAHEKLEQNVEEAMRLNKALTSVNRNQESTIYSLEQNMEELSNKLIKAKVSSVSRSEENYNHTAKEQQTQQLQLRLHVETEMNKKLRDENTTERADKQEVMISLQDTQQLLLRQTEAVGRLEQELHTQAEEHQQALKREHEVRREKAEAEGRFAQLLEEYRNSTMVWENEKLVLQEGLQSEQQALRSLREDYDHLHQKHCELSSQAILQTEHIQELQNGLENLGKGCQNSTAECRDLFIQDKCDSDEVHREDTVGVEGVEPAVESHPTQENAHDKYKPSVNPAAPSMESQSEDLPQTAPSEVINLPQTPSDHSPGCPDPEGAGEEGGHSEAYPGPEVPKPGCAETLAPSQSGGCLVVTDSPLTETAPVVDVLTRPICGAMGGQPDESNTEHTLNPSLGQRHDPHPAAVSSLIDNACVASGVLSSEGGVMIGLSGSGNRSVYARVDVVVSGSMVEGTKDEERQEEGRMECTPETTNPQTSDKFKDRWRGASSSPQDIDLADAEAPLASSQTVDLHTVLQRASESDCATNHLEKESEVRIHSVDESRSSDCSRNTQDTGGISSHAQPALVPTVSNIDITESGETHNEPVRVSGTVSEEAIELQPTTSQEISPENGHVTVTPDAGACEVEHPSKVELRVNEAVPLRSASDTLSTTSVGPPASEREDQCDKTVAVDKMIGQQHADGDSANTVAVDKMIRQLHADGDSANTVAVDKMIGQHADGDSANTVAVDKMIGQHTDADSANTVAVDKMIGQLHADGDSANTVAVDKMIGQQHPDGDQNDKAAEDKRIGSMYPISHPANDEVDISPKSSQSEPTDQIKAKEMQCGDIIDPSFLASKKRYRSSFDWTPQKQDLHTRNRPGTPDQDRACAAGPRTSAVSDLKTRQPSGLKEPPSLFPFPYQSFLQGRQTSREYSVMSRAAEVLTAPSLYPPHRRDQHGEWNAIRETFSETVAEKESRVPFSVGSRLSLAPHSTTTSRLARQQNHHSSGMASGSDRFPPSSQENKDTQHSDIRAQIAKIEHFLCSEGIRMPKRRRMDD